MTLHELITTDKVVVKELHEFLIQVLKQEAIDRIFEKQDVSGIADAKIVIDKAFEEMELVAEPKDEKKRLMHNEAR